MNSKTTIQVLIIWLVSHVRCSRVIDSVTSMTGIRVSDYCPRIKGCKRPATHVMCIKNPNVVSWFGPHCHEVQNITITDQIALRIVGIFNAVRSKVAHGLERGEGGARFPRGYGIHRVNWDSELATFAQIWANQCVFYRDYCRSTKRFEQPGQLLGMVRFNYPDWMPISTSWESKGAGFEPGIIVHSVIQIIKKWYLTKSTITPEMLNKITSATMNIPYLYFLSGSLTHMGCGVSAYAEYCYDTADVDLLYNSVLLVCNFSNRVKAGKPLYDTTPIKNSLCGCPPGTKADDDCLCIDHEEPLCNSKRCKPAVVLLPIITVEEPPMSKLRNISRTSYNKEFEDEEHPYDKILNPKRRKGDCPNKYGRNVTMSVHRTTLHDSPLPTNNEYSFLHEKPSILHPKLILPMPSLKNKAVTIPKRELNLTPRRNFNKLQNFLANFLNPVPNINTDATPRSHEEVENKKILPHMEETTHAPVEVVFDPKQHYYAANNYLDKIYTEPIDHKHGSSILENFSTNLNKNDPFYSAMEIKSSDNAEIKLIKLMNLLEREVKKSNLGSRERNIFDQKLKTIYNTIVMKSDGDFPTKSRIDDIWSPNADHYSPNFNFSHENDMFNSHFKPDPKHSDGHNSHHISRVNKQNIHGDELFDDDIHGDRYKSGRRLSSYNHRKANDFSDLNYPFEIQRKAGNCPKNLPPPDVGRHQFHDNYKTNNHINLHEEFENDSDYPTNDNHKPEARHHGREDNLYLKFNRPMLTKSGRRPSVPQYPPHIPRPDSNPYSRPYHQVRRYNNYERRLNGEPGLRSDNNGPPIQRTKVEIDLQRRRYYQERLDALEKQLHGARGHPHTPRQPLSNQDIMIVRPTLTDLPRPGVLRNVHDVHDDMTYLPLRGKTLHGL